MTSLIYDSFMDDLCKGNIVPSSDTFYGMLVTSSYSPSKGTHAKRSDVTNEASGTNYTAGRPGDFRQERYCRAGCRREA